MPRLPRPLILIAATLLTGCSGLQQRSASLHPGDTATVWFEGTGPMIEIRNVGPGEVGASATAERDPAVDAKLARDQRILWTFTGQGTAIITNTSDTNASIDVITRDARNVRFSFPHTPVTIRP